MTRGRMPVSAAIAARNSPPFSRLARRAGGGGENLVHAMRLGEPPEFRQRLQRGVHRLGRQRAAVEPAGAQPDHFLFAVDDLERKVRPHPHHDHVHRIGADVDGREAHMGVRA